MKYHTFKINNKEYKLRLTTGTIIETEKKLGKSILDVLMSVENGKMPAMEDLIIVLHGSLQKFHRISIKDTYDIFDEFVDDGGDMTELIQVITEVLQVSGFFKKQPQEQEAVASV